MKKSKIKNMLFSMRTADNEEIINNLLGKIDLLDEQNLQNMLKHIGDNEESIKSYLQEKISLKQNQDISHIPINKMFSYGVSENSIHLHMPVNLHEMFSNIGISKTVDTINLYLLDAIETIRRMQLDGFYKFIAKDSIYMISPILIKKELIFLNELDFKTQIYKKEELQDEQFVANHPKSQLVIKIFGSNKDVGTATIKLDVINSKEWQEKKSKQIQKFNEKGIKLENEEKYIRTN